MAAMATTPNHAEWRISTAKREQDELAQRVKLSTTLLECRAAQNAVRTSVYKDNTYLSNLIVEAYARLGSLQEARQTLDAMAAPNVFSWTIMLAAYAAKGHLLEARQLYDQMPQRNVQSETAMAVCYARMRQPHEAVRLFQAMPERNLVACNAMVAALAAGGDLEGSKRCFDSMPLRDVVSWTSLVNAYAEDDRVNDARRVFDSMAEWNAVAWTSMLAAYARRGDDMVAARSTLQSMPQRTVVAWNALLSGYVHAGMVNEAVAVFESMPEWDLISCGVMVAMYGHSGDVTAAERVFRLVPRDDRDLVVCNAMLGAYAQNGHLVSARRIFDEEMPIRDIVSWTQLLVACVRAGSLCQMEDAFQQMPERDITAWNTVVGAYALAGHLETAKAKFDSMGRWDLVSWNSMLSAFVAGDSPNDAWRWFWFSMPQHDCFAWNTALRSCCSSAEEARQLLHQMPERGILSWNVLLAVYAAGGASSELLRKQFEQIPTKSLEAWSTMVAAATAAAEQGSAEELLAEILLHGEKPNETSFLGALGGGGVNTVAHSFRSMVVDHGSTATAEHYACIVDALAKTGQLQDAEDLMANMPFVPDCAQWTSLLGASRVHFDVRRAVSAAVRVDAGCSSRYLLVASSLTAGTEYAYPERQNVPPTVKE